MGSVLVARGDQALFKTGFNSYLAYYPEDKPAVAVLGNLNGNAPQEIAGIPASLAHGVDDGNTHGF